MQPTFVIPEDALRGQARADGITHLSAGIAIVRNGKVLVVRRAPDDFLGGYYELPGGGVDPGESLRDAIVREAAEETGLAVAGVLGMFSGFDYTTPQKPHVRQMNFLVQTSDDEVKLSAEHDAYAWVALEDMESLRLTDSQKKCVMDALELAVSV